MQLIKNLTLSISILFSLLSLKAKGDNLHGNEWLIPGQQYYKTQVWQTGFYRIDYTLFTSSGLSLSTFQPQNIQLFFRGMQQSIYVNDQNNNNTFDQEDYIEFWGQKNEGTLDKAIYVTEQSQLNPYYNLFSDTCSYFITASPTGPYKRITALPAVTGGLDQAYIRSETINIFSRNYSNGAGSNDRNDAYAVDARYSYADGWADSKSGLSTYTLNLEKVYTPSPGGSIELLLNNYNSADQTLQIRAYNDKGDSEIIKKIEGIIGYRNTVFIDSIPGKLFNGSKIHIEVQLLKGGAFTVSYAKFSYNQLLNTNTDNKTFYTSSLSQSALGYELTTFPANPVVYDITDSFAINIITSVSSSSNLKFGIEQSSKDKKILIRDGAQYLSPTIPAYIKVLPLYKSLARYASSDSVYIIISHKALMKSATGYANPVRAYADYRASQAGGRFDTLLVSFPDLCDNFNYGEESPLAIRKFLKYMCQDINHIPDYLFLIGKGISVMNQNSDGKFYRHLKPSEKTIPNYIPPMGNPASDLLYSAGLANLPENAPAISTGRLAAFTSEDVAAYLNKIIVSESQPQNELWNKQILHLSGGRDLGQIQMFRSYVDAWGTIAKGDYWGAKVATYSKTTVNFTQIFDISKEVNNGVKLITFFGHSGKDGTDISIGFVDDPVYNYHNKDKYPMMIVNGCLGGNAFDQGSLGETWIKAPNRGAISVLALTDEGFNLQLNNYTSHWYLKQFADSTYSNKSIGDIHKIVSKQFVTNYPDLYSVAQAQQMLLQGDPAFVLFKSTLPDYQLSDAQLFIKSLDKNNNPITAITDSFKIGMIVKNLGKTDLYKRQLPIRVTRTLPDGNKIQYAPQYYVPVRHEDTLYFTIFTSGTNSFGNNSFVVEVDFNNRIRELDENNNTAKISFFLQQSSVSCLYPREFSIVNNPTVNLIAQSTDLFASTKSYLFEIDTAWTFNSAYKKTYTVQALSLPAVSDFTLIPISDQDSLVYYWRVRYKDLSVNIDTLYGTSSFLHIPHGNPGWAQAQFPQFLKNTNSFGLSNNIINRKQTFDISKIDLEVKTQADDYTKALLNVNKIPHIYNGNQIFYWEGIPGGMLALAFRKSTIESYTIFGEILHPNGSVNLYLRGINTNGFLSDDFLADSASPKSRYGFTKAYLDSVGTGDYVLFFTSADAQIGHWGSSLKNRLIKQGAKKIQSLKDGYPYIILYKKDVGVIAEITANTTDSILARSIPIGLDTSIAIQYNKGTVSSTKIGPASTWRNLYRKVITDHSTDAWKFNICGYTLSNQKDTLWTGIPVDGMDISNIVDSTKYAYMSLEAVLTDSAGNNPTPPNLDHWIVTYNNNVPEGILSVNTTDTPLILNKTYQEGEKLKVVYDFKNITNIPFKSPLYIQYLTKSINNGTTYIEYDTIFTVLEAQKTFSKTHYFDTQGYVGDVNFQIFVNPYLQAEEYYTNNVLVISGKVIRNTFNPILEVTFDGNKIMDGDIVSPNPSINITVSDFNKYLKKTDASGLKILIKKDQCSSCAFTQIPSDSPEIRFVPEGNNNKYHIEYKPKALSDARYIMAVQATDAIGLESGINPYQVRFEVINKSTVTNFYPYPNPFTDQTRFVFTLTGSEIPDEIKIQIMTVSGIVVKEIFQNEIGPIRIGNNITQYAWDGKDQFGDKLANGVYLYRVHINSRGSQVEHRDSGGDQAFKNNIGKIVILR